MKIPNYDKLLFIERWYHCDNCGNPDGLDIQLISKKDFADYKDFNCKIEGTMREQDYSNDKKQSKDIRGCFITLKDFFPQLKWSSFKDFVEGGDFKRFTEKEIKQLDGINWEKFGKEFEKFVTQNCPKKRVMKWG